MNKRIFLTLIGLLFLQQYLLAYEHNLFQNYTFMYKYDLKISLYNNSLNPVYFNMDKDIDYYIYDINSDYSQNDYFRIFDPMMDRSYNASFFNYKILDEKSRLSTAVIYDWSKKYNMYGSLEKNFYDHYFAFTDTTTGNTVYYGPRLWLLYNRQLTEKISTAFQIDYGIERGLKDVFTECGTIFRSVNLNIGLGYQSKDKSFISGVYGRYFDRQGKYEAVEDLISAENYTYIGYFVSRHENPRSTNTKSDREKGFESGINALKTNIFIKNLDYSILASVGTSENKVRTGSTSMLTTVGYWVREAYKISNKLSYTISPIRTKVNISYVFTHINDWAKHGQFEVTLLTYVSQIQKMGIDLEMTPLQSLYIRSGFESQSNRVDYIEYVSDFDYFEKINSTLYFTNWQWRVNSILNIYTGYEYCQDEPFFYWGTPQFDIQKVFFAWDRLFIFGRIGMRIDYSIWNPKEFNENIKTYGLSFTYSR